MIPLNTYQEVRLDVLRVFYRYHTIPNTVLKKSSIQNDMEKFFRKWSSIIEVKDAKRFLDASFEKHKNSPDYITIEIYRDCIDDMLHTLEISDRIDRTERNMNFCKAVKKAQDRYRRKHKNYFEYDF